MAGTSLAQLKATCQGTKSDAANMYFSKLNTVLDKLKVKLMYPFDFNYTNNGALLGGVRKTKIESKRRI